MKIRARVNRSGSKSYQLDYGEIDGKRLQISFPTRIKAEAAMTAARTRLRTHGHASLALSETTKARYVAAEDRLRASGGSIESAVDFFLQHHGEIREPITFAEATKRCIEEKRAENKRQRYLDALQCASQALGRAGFADRSVREIDAAALKGWLRAGGWSPKTMQIYLGHLRVIFGWIKREKYRADNPCAGIKTPALDDRPPGIFTVPQSARLLVAALRSDRRLQLLGYIAVGLLAGIRPEEMSRLAWSEIHLEERYIEVPARKSKTRRRRIVEIGDSLGAWLAIAQQPASEMLAPRNLRKRFGDLRRVARLGAAWPQDGMRHSFASYHLAAHGSAEKTSAQLGHHNTAMLYAHYRELVRPRDATAFWKLRPTPRMLARLKAK